MRFFTSGARDPRAETIASVERAITTISPVFTSLDELCPWAAEHATTFGSFNKATAEEWKAMLDGGSVHHKEGDNIFL